MNKGVCITLCESQRKRQDERRYGPRGEEQEFGGAVISRRQPRQSRAQQIKDKEKEEAAVFPLDSMMVLCKKPDARLKWLEKGLIYAAKKYIHVAGLYDIATNKKFADGVSAAVGKQMGTVLTANLHLFSTKQQRVLLSNESGFQRFFRAGGGDSDSGRSRSPENRGRSVSRSRSHDCCSEDDTVGNARSAELTEVFAGSSQPLRPPPLIMSRRYVSRYPYPLPDILPGEDVRKYAFGTADDFLSVGDDIEAYASPKGDQES